MYLPSPWLQGTNHPSSNKDRAYPWELFKSYPGKSALQCPGLLGSGPAWVPSVWWGVSGTGWVVLASDTVPCWHHQVGSLRRPGTCDIPSEVGSLCDSMANLRSFSPPPLGTPTYNSSSLILAPSKLLGDTEWLSVAKGDSRWNK